MPIFVLLCLFFTSASAHGLGLPGAVEYAVRNSPVLETFRRNARIGELEATSSTSRLLPSLDLNGSAIIPRTSGVSLNLTENLYDNGVSWTKRRIAQLNEQVSALEFARAREKLALDVAEEFYKFSLATQLLEVTQTQAELIQKQFESLSIQYREGLRTRKDYLRLKGRAQRAAIDVLGAKNSAEASVTELLRLLGGPASELSFEPLKPEKAVPPIPSAPPPMEKHFDYRLAGLVGEIENATADLARRALWPELSATAAAGYGYSDIFGTDASRSAGWTWSGTLTLKYNIFDWGTRRRDVQVAEHRAAIEKNRQDEKLLATQSALSNVMRVLEKLHADFRLNRELLDLSLESYNLLQEEYRGGKIAYLDLITSLDELLDARVKFYTAYYNLLQNLARYQYHKGELYDGLIANH